MANIWFGNDYSARYVPAPQSGMDASGVGYSNVVELNSGGAFVDQSSAVHRVYEMEWSAAKTSDLSFLTEYYSGVRGSGYLYWVDPFADNALPPHWSAPMLLGQDWPSIVTPGMTGDAIVTPANAFDLPAEGRCFLPSGLANTVPERSLTLLIPRDRALHLGFFGLSEGAVLRAHPQKLDGSWGDTLDIQMLGANSSMHVNTSFSGSQYRLVRIYITPVRVGGKLSIYGGKATYTNLGNSARLDRTFTMGTGHTGLRFAESPTISYIQSARRRNMVSASASLIEVEAWE